MTADDIELLVAFSLGECGPDDAARLRSRLEGSAELRRALENVRGLIRTLQTDDSTEAPAAAVRRALDLFRAEPRPGPLGGLREVWARLVHDTASGAALAGFRGAGAEQHLSFHSDEGDIDLRIEPVAGSRERRLAGQIDAGLARARVVLTRGGSSTAEIEADDSGVFLVRLEPGRYGLRVEAGAVAIYLPEFEVA